jgi:signal transduction histidine kinase
LIPNSLRFRLFGAAVIIILVAVQIAGVMLLVMFERNAIRLVHSELDAALELLATLVGRDQHGVTNLSNDSVDPHLRQRISGRYWQISANGEALLRSRSLGNAKLDIGNLAEGKHGTWRQVFVGPDKQQLYGSFKRIVLGPTADGQPTLDFLLVVAMDVAEIRALDALNGQLRGDVFAALALLAVILIAAAWTQMLMGLRPLKVLRTGLENIRIGNARRLSDKVPSELQPLVAETNRLLEAQEKAIETARARADDLAHGLKTPLTALTVLAGKLRQEHKTDFASELEQQLNGLSKHVERELTRTRIAASKTVAKRTPVESIVGRLFRAMEKLPRGDGIDWRLDCEANLIAPVEEADLAEILGNLLDNARKWARSEVGITARSLGEGVELVIHDDGPGVPESDRARVMRRGTRLDESMPGSGLGLNIANAIVEAYGGNMVLDSSACGGLSVRLRLPRLASSAVTNLEATALAR